MLMRSDLSIFAAVLLCSRGHPLARAISQMRETDENYRAFARYMMERSDRDIADGVSLGECAKCGCPCWEWSVAVFRCDAEFDFRRLQEQPCWVN